MYCAIDIERVKTEDWFIERHIINNNGDESKTISVLTELLQWRKSYGLNERKDSYFPAEFFALQYLSVGGKWTNGEIMLIAAASHYFPPRSKYIRELFTQFTIHMFNKFDTENTSKTKPAWAILNNWTNKNIDMVMYEQYLSFVMRNMPLSPRPAIATGLTPIVQKLFNMVKYLSPELTSIVQFRNDTKGFFHISDQPKVFGGNKLIKRIPTGVRSGKCLAHLTHIAETDWDDFYAKNIDLLLSAAEDDGAGTLHHLFKC